MKKKFKFKKSVKVFFFVLLVVGICFVAYNVIMNNDKDNNYNEGSGNNQNTDKIDETLLTLGYSEEDISVLKANLSDSEISSLDMYDDNVISFVSNKYFNFNNLERYITYSKNNNYDVDEIITHVNINIDKPFYSEIKTIEDPSNLLVLCNKYNALPSDYEPEDLTEVGSSGIYMRKEAAENMYQMVLAAESAGLNVNLVSGYRSYDYQVDLYQRHVRERGQEEADRVSARAGHSEHQTGLAMDLSNDWSLEKYFEDTELFEWLSENDYKYGFILRYPKDKEYLTGYDYEPWHYRYVGVEVATVIHEEDITYEEYVMKYLTTN